jgi:hypothetical protein
MKIEPELDAHSRPGISAGQSVDRTGISNGANRRIVDRIISARPRNLNIRDCPVAQNIKRHHRARRNTDTWIDGRLQPTAADAPLHRLHVPRKARAEVATADAVEPQSSLRSAAYRERCVGHGRRATSSVGDCIRRRRSGIFKNLRGPRDVMRRRFQFEFRDWNRIGGRRSLDFRRRRFVQTLRFVHHAMPGTLPMTPTVIAPPGPPQSSLRWEK